HLCLCYRSFVWKNVQNDVQKVVRNDVWKTSSCENHGEPNQPLQSRWLQPGSPGREILKDASSAPLSSRLIVDDGKDPIVQPVACGIQLHRSQAYPCSSDKECEVGRYCHSPHQGSSACMVCRRKKKRCHRDGMCCPGNRCNNGICIPVTESILTPHIPALDGTRHRDRNHGHYSNHDLGWQNLGRPHTKMSHIKGHEGDPCLRSSDCMEGFCCARHFWTKICKPVLHQGEVCTKQRKKGSHGLEIFQRCDCAKGLSCKVWKDATYSSKARLHVRIRQPSEGQHRLSDGLAASGKSHRSRGLTRIQGPTASPGPGTQAHPDPGAHGLTRTRGQAHPDPGAHGLTRTRDPGSPGSRGPRPHPDPGPGSPGSRGPRPHPDPGPRLTRIQGPTASPGPGARLTRIQGPTASPGPVHDLIMHLVHQRAGCPPVHQAFRKPPARRRLSKGLVPEQTAGQLPCFGGGAGWLSAGAPGLPKASGAAMAQMLSSRRQWRRELSILLAQSATPATLSPAPCASCWPNCGRSGVMGEHHSARSWLTAGEHSSSGGASPTSASGGRPKRLALRKDPWGRGKTLVAELGVADCVAAGTSFLPAAVFLWPPADRSVSRSEFLSGWPIVLAGGALIGEWPEENCCWQKTGAGSQSCAHRCCSHMLMAPAPLAPVDSVEQLQPVPAPGASGSCCPNCPPGAGGGGESLRGNQGRQPPLSPTDGADAWHQQRVQVVAPALASGASGAGTSSRAGPRHRQASDGNYPATQGQPEVEESLGWRLPSHPGLPEAQETRANGRLALPAMAAAEMPNVRNSCKGLGPRSLGFIWKVIQKDDRKGHAWNMAGIGHGGMVE
ncbi:hypothetical protein QTO34_008139, partial [Cnephaeus nilssonii]